MLRKATLRNRQATMLALLVSGLVAFGCGGSDEESISKAAYVKQGNEICEEAREQKEDDVMATLAKRGDDAGLMNRAESEAMFTDDVLPAVTQMIDGLVGLGEPDPGAEEAEAMIAAFEAGVDEYEANLAKTLRVGNEPMEEAQDLATDFGLKACSEV
jgi:hypothetical protein